MRVPPNGFRPIDSSSSSTINTKNEISKAKFSEKLDFKKVELTHSIAAADILTEVKDLAALFKSGALSKEEASKKFVSLVIEKRHDLDKFGEKGKQIEEAVKEFAGEDPQFVSSLVRQLQKLA